MKIENDNIWLSLGEVCDVLKLNQNSFNVNSGRQGTYKSVIKRRCTNDKGWYIEVLLSSFPNEAQSKLLMFYSATIIEIKQQDKSKYYQKINDLAVQCYDKEDIKILENDYNCSREKANKYAWRAAWMRVCILDKRTIRLHFPDFSKFQFLEIVQFCIYEANVFEMQKPSLTYIQKLMANFTKRGLSAVVDGRNKNKNGLKADELHKKIIKAIVLGTNSPNAVEVHKSYNDFLKGDKVISEKETGEVFSPAKFCELSLSWVNKYLQTPEMIAVFARKHAGKVVYESRFRPFLHGEKPQFSLSLVTCDDWEMPVFVGTKRPVTYIAFDVATGAILSFVRAKDNRKDGILFEDCLKTMLLNDDLGGFLPAEIQTEQHICSLYKDTLLREGNIFQYVTIEEGERPMAKYAEGFIKQLKYSLLKSEDFFRGRPHARLLTNRFNKNKKYASITEEELEVLMAAIVEEWNSRPAEEGEKESRIEKMRRLRNLKLLPIDYVQIAQYLGKKIETTLRNGQYFYASNKKWHLPNVDILSKLDNNHLEVRILENLKDKVFVFQNNKFICECGEVKTMQRSKIEQTEKDKAVLGEFMAYRNEAEAITKQAINEGKAISVSKDSLLSRKLVAKVCQSVVEEDVIEEIDGFLDEEMEDNVYIRLYHNQKIKG